jgi:hypothetical protein
LSFRHATAASKEESVFLLEVTTMQETDPSSPSDLGGELDFEWHGAFNAAIQKVCYQGTSLNSIRIN